jgi:antitoxin (DNA-binding transcriptional repressor) of toxin-antitoxin stability system
MAVFHISEHDAAQEFPALMARVRSGVEVVIEADEHPVAVLRSLAPTRRTIEECIALLPADPATRMGEDFARDVEDAIAFHREALDPPAWE